MILRQCLPGVERSRNVRQENSLLSEVYRLRQQVYYLGSEVYCLRQQVYYLRSDVYCLRQQVYSIQFKDYSFRSEVYYMREEENSLRINVFNLRKRESCFRRGKAKLGYHHEIINLYDSVVKSDKSWQLNSKLEWPLFKGLQLFRCNDLIAFNNFHCWWF